MSRLDEREIARRLAEREELEPPAGLLDRIKSEIPPSIRPSIQMDAEGAEPPPPSGFDRRSAMPATRRWLIAASLVATVGAGLFALRVREEAPSPQPVARPIPAVTTAPAPAPLEKARRPLLPKPAPSPAPLQNLESRMEPLKRERDLKSAGPGVADRPEGRIEGGVVGGVPGGAAAAPPPAPVAAPAAKAAPEDVLSVTAESPLLDERRVSTGATLSQSELEKIPTARDPWSVLQTTPGVLTDRINVGGNESGQQSEYQGPGGPLSTVEVGADTGSYAAARRDLAAGRLPDPGAVRIADFVSAFGGGAARRMPWRRDFQVQAEGAPTPFLQGPRDRLLRFSLQGRASQLKGARVEVEINPEVVARYRPLGGENRAVAGERGVTVLYEIELRADAPGKGRVATLRLRDPAGREDGTQGTLDLPALAPSWEQASPGFRLTALAAELAGILKGSPAAKGKLAAIARQAREIGERLPKSAGAAELADLAERAARLRGE